MQRNGADEIQFKPSKIHFVLSPFMYYRNFMRCFIILIFVLPQISLSILLVFNQF